MKKLKYYILFIILVMSVGIAAVSTNLQLNGSTSISKNVDDFNVYFSNVKVNGTQDLSLVRSETSLVFKGDFSAVGDKKTITYDVTNASKNYDANIDISCTQSTEYLTINNSFDTDSYLSARSTRTGVLTITLSKSYTGSDLTQDISCTISSSAVERASQGSGSTPSAVEPILIDFSVDDTVYSAVKGMTWAEWVESEYNTAGFSLQENFDFVFTSYNEIMDFKFVTYELCNSNDECAAVRRPSPGDLIVSGTDYYIGYFLSSPWI